MRDGTTAIEGKRGWIPPQPPPTEIGGGTSYIDGTIPKKGWGG